MPHTTMKTTFATLSLLALALTSLNLAAQSARPARQAEIAARGSPVMPFELARTIHVFNKTTSDGVQQVIVKDPADTRQIELIHQHLAELKARFGDGDFNCPTDIHGTDMPGLAALKAAKPGDRRVSYKRLPNGAQLTYASPKAALRSALHDWFDAQLADHGRDATARLNRPSQAPLTSNMVRPSAQRVLQPDEPEYFPESLRQAAIELKLTTGEVLFRVGDPVRFVYRVQQGELRLVRYGSTGVAASLQVAG